MPRRSIKLPRLEPHQRALASMIDEALRRGQCGDGTDPRHWQEWTNRSFADAAKASENAVANWRDPDKRMPPEDITPLLKAFYGTIDRFKDDKARMKRLWQLARGYIDDDEPRSQDWDIDKPSNLQGTASLVRLLAHAPVPWNDGTLRLSITLVITPDRDLTYRGKGVMIGLSEALLRMQCENLQPAWNSRPSERGLENFVLDADGDRVVGPIEPASGMINGQPLGNEHFFTFERLSSNAPPGSITVTVHAPRGSFRVRPRPVDGPSVPRTRANCSVNQTAVVNALFYEQLRNRDDHDRAVLARAQAGARPDQCP